MVKVIVAILLALAAVCGVVAFIGSRLSVSHVATRSIIVRAPADVVFTTMTDFASGPTWRDGLESTTVSTDAASGRTRVTEISSTGDLTFEVEQMLPPARIVMRIVGQGLPFGGAWAFALEPLGNDTRVTITEHGEVYNPLFRFVSRYIIGHTGGLESYLTSLGRKFGTEMAPVDAPAVPLQ
jgi:hypothetical protein